MAEAYRGDTFRAMAVRRILMLAIVCAITPARASPRTDPTVGRAVFTGATLPHATSLALDPAAIGLASFNEVYVSLATVIDQLHIQLDRVDLTGTQTPGPAVRDVELGPGAMVAFIYHLAGESVTIGFEARTSPREAFPTNREPLRYHTLGNGERDWLGSLGGSLKVTNELLVGASLSHQNTFLRLRYARDTALAAGNGPGGVTSDCGGQPCGIANPQATELYDVDVRSRLLSTSNLRFNVGAIYQIARDMWLGVAYHTPPGFAVQTELAGHVTVERAPRVRVPDELPIRGQSVVEIQFPASVDAELRARLPHKLDLHVGGRWEDLSRLSGYDVRTYGSTLPRIGIPEWTERPRGMHDAFALWAGVDEVDDGKAPRTYGARLGIETSSVDDARTSPLTIAPTSFTADVGAQWRTQVHLIFQLSYGLQYFPTVTVVNSAFDPRDQISCLDSGVDYTTRACDAVRNGYAIASGAGTYSRIQHALRLGVRYEF
jgi:hypothetical protein